MTTAETVAAAVPTLMLVGTIAGRIAESAPAGTSKKIAKTVALLLLDAVGIWKVWTDTDGTP